MPGAGAKPQWCSGSSAAPKPQQPGGRDPRHPEALRRPPAGRPHEHKSLIERDWSAPNYRERSHRTPHPRYRADLLSTAEAGARHAEGPPLRENQCASGSCAATFTDTAD